MLTVMVIALGAMVLIGSATLAFTFGSDEPEPKPERTQPTPSLVLFQPTGWTTDLKQIPVEDLVASIEDHLKQERALAERFARDPSARNLWLD